MRHLRRSIGTPPAGSYVRRRKSGASWARDPPGPGRSSRRKRRWPPGCNPSFASRQRGNELVIGYASSPPSSTRRSPRPSSCRWTPVTPAPPTSWPAGSTASWVTSRPSAGPWRKLRGRRLPAGVPAANLVAATRLVDLPRALAPTRGLALDRFAGRPSRSQVGECMFDILRPGCDSFRLVVASRPCSSSSSARGAT